MTGNFPPTLLCASSIEASFGTDDVLGIGILLRPNNNALDILLSQTNIESRSLTSKKPISCREDINACEVRVAIAPALTKIIELCVDTSTLVSLPSMLRSFTVPISISDAAIHDFVTSTKLYLMSLLTETSSTISANVPSPSPVPNTTTCSSL